MNPLTQQLNALAGQKSLEEEIIEALQKASEPLTSHQIFDRVTACDTRLDLLNTLRTMADDKLITLSPKEGGSPLFGLPNEDRADPAFTGIHAHA